MRNIAVFRKPKTYYWGHIRLKNVELDHLKVYMPTQKIKLNLKQYGGGMFPCYL